MLSEFQKRVWWVPKTSAMGGIQMLNRTGASAWLKQCVSKQSGDKQRGRKRRINSVERDKGWWESLQGVSLWLCRIKGSPNENCVCTAAVSDTGIWLFHTTLSRTFYGPALTSEQLLKWRWGSAALKEGLGHLRWQGAEVANGANLWAPKNLRTTQNEQSKISWVRNEGREEGSGLNRCSIGWSHLCVPYDGKRL